MGVRGGNPWHGTCALLNRGDQTTVDDEVRAGDVARPIAGQHRSTQRREPLRAPEDAGVQEAVKGKVRELCERFPLYDALM